MAAPLKLEGETCDSLLSPSDAKRFDHEHYAVMLTHVLPPQ